MSKRYSKKKGVKATLQDAGELAASAAAIGALEALAQGGGFESILGAVGAALGLDPTLTTLAAVALGKLAARWVVNWRKHRAPKLGEGAVAEARGNYFRGPRG